MERINKGKSVIDFPDEYVCIDVETTGLNYEYDEIIEVSAIIVKNGEIVDKMTSLVKPNDSHTFITFGVLQQMGYNTFSEVPESVLSDYMNKHIIPQYITDLTGITNEMLQSAPTPDAIFPSLFDFIGERVIVGHNVNFDINFLYDACERHGMTMRNDFIDTMRIARKLLPDLPHHRLVDIVDALDVQQDNQHRAESDAVATYLCFEKMRNSVVNSMGIDAFKDSFKKKYHGKYDILADIILPVGEIDETNPVFGKQVVFTGALSRMGRKAALQIVANLGGVPANSVTKKTNYLVVGNEEFVASVKDGKTAKMKKADEYQHKGLDIVTLSEDTFFDMID